MEEKFTEEIKIDSFRIWDDGKVVLSVDETFYKDGQFIGKRQREIEVIDGNLEHLAIIQNYLTKVTGYYKMLQ
ncbi:MAG: hypothetical protein ACRC11_18090 [Xenococcaceae cyanobacterium]